MNYSSIKLARPNNFDQNKSGASFSFVSISYNTNKHTQCVSIMKLARFSSHFGSFFRLLPLYHGNEPALSLLIWISSSSRLFILHVKMHWLCLVEFQHMTQPPYSAYIRSECNQCIPKRYICTHTNNDIQ